VNLCENSLNLCVIKSKHLVTNIYYLSSISPLGNDPTVIWQNYLNDKHYFVKEIIDNATFIAPFVDAVDGIEPKMSDTKYKFLDKSVLYAIEVSEKQFSRQVGLQTTFLNQHGFLSCNRFI
jgi:hypothetical protein